MSQGRNLVFLFFNSFQDASHLIKKINLMKLYIHTYIYIHAHRHTHTHRCLNWKSWMNWETLPMLFQDSFFLNWPYMWESIFVSLLFSVGLNVCFYAPYSTTFKKIVCFWLCWVFLATHELSLAAASRGYSSLCCTCLLRWLRLLEHGL